MRTVGHLMGIASLTTMGLGCAIGTGAGAPAREDSGPVEVGVENRGWSDTVIYLVSNGLTHCLGLATAVGTTTLWVPERVRRDSYDLRLISAPIGSNRSHTTEPLLVRPGQLVALTLENQLGMSSWGVW